MNKHAGFTIMETMVAVSVAAILLTVGLPQMSIFFKGNRMTTNTNEMVSGLQITRSQAIKEGGRVTICRSKNADTGSPSCDTGSDKDWDTGFIVYVEGTNAGNTIGQYSSSDDGDIIRLNTGVEGNKDEISILASSTDMEDFVSFTSRGVPKRTNGSNVSGVFSVCDDRGETNASGNVVARAVELGASGRIRSSKLAAKITCP